MATIVGKPILLTGANPGIVRAMENALDRGAERVHAGTRPARYVVPPGKCRSALPMPETLPWRTMTSTHRTACPGRSTT